MLDANDTSRLPNPTPVSFFTLCHTYRLLFMLAVSMKEHEALAEAVRMENYRLYAYEAQRRFVGIKSSTMNCSDTLVIVDYHLFSAHTISLKIWN